MPLRRNFENASTRIAALGRVEHSVRIDALAHLVVFTAVLAFCDVAMRLGSTRSFLTNYAPASGLVLGVLLLAPRLQRWRVVANAAFATFFFHVVFRHEGPASSFAFSLVAAIEWLVAAAVWRRVERILVQSETPIRIVTALSTCAALGPAVGACLATLVFYARGTDLSFAEIGIRWWFAEVIGIVSIAPLILAWSGSRRAHLPIAYNGKNAEGLVLLFALFTLLTVSYVSQNASLALNMQFFVLPLLMIMAFRFGPRGITLVLLVVTLFNVAELGRALASGEAQGTTFENALHTQVYLFAIHVCFFFLGVLASEKEATLKKLQQLTHFAPVGIFFRAADGRVSDSNPRLGEILADVCEQDATALLSRAVDACEMRLSPSNASHSDKWVHCHSSLVVADSGHVLGRVGAIVDITFQKKIQNELERSHVLEKTLRQNAENMMRMREEFVSVVSHELATPMTGIIGWAQMLAAGHLSPERQKAALQNILRCAHQESRLISELLDFSQVLASKLDLRLGTVDLAVLLQKSYERVRFAAEAKGVLIEVRTDGNAVLVRGDEERLQQALWQVLSNAVKFSEVGDRVLISVDHQLKKATIRVKDEGKGIAPEFLPHVFDLFSQEDASLTRQQGGLGLGLAIARRIVELHDGTIVVESAGLGKGAEFTVKMPTENYTAPREYDEVLLDPALKPSQKLEGLRIMVVDDDPDCLDILSSWLSSQGAEIQAFSEARDAYLQVVGLQPHVVLSDLSMPHVDGITFIEKLCATRHYGERSIIIAAVTAFGDDQKRREAMSKGFNGYFVKPYRFCELLDWLIEQKKTLEERGQVTHQNPSEQEDASV